MLLLVGAVGDLTWEDFQEAVLAERLFEPVRRKNTERTFPTAGLDRIPRWPVRTMAVRFSLRLQMLWPQISGMCCRRFRCSMHRSSDRA